MTAIRLTVTNRRCPASALLAVPLMAVALGALACSSSYRRVELGSAQASIGAGASAPGVAVQESSDRYQIDFHITTSAATELTVLVRCPGGVHEATIGESMASYRERRLRELSYEQQRRDQQRAQVVGAASAAVSGVARVETPAVSAEAGVQVDVAAAQSAPVVELGPYDLGAQSIHQTVVLPGGGAGQCSMSLLPVGREVELAGVTGYMEVTHLVDRAAARTRQRQRDSELALRFRSTIQADLIARGADPDLRRRLALAEQEKQRAEQAARDLREREARRKRNDELLAERERERKQTAEAQRVADAEARARASLQAKVPAVRLPAARVEVQVRTPVKVSVPAKVAVDPQIAIAQRAQQADLLLRRRIADACVAGGADVYYRARLRQERFNREQQESLERELRAQAEIAVQLDLERRRQEQLIVDLGTRETLVAHLLASGADPAYRRKQNEADLLSFEERSRAARYQAQRDASARVDVDVDAELEFDTEVSVAGASQGLASATASATVPPPARPAEVRPPAPDAQSSWIAGFFQWQGAAWVWVPGTWSTPPVVDAVWVPTVEIRLGGQRITRPGSWRTRQGKRVGVGSVTAQPRVRDHRR